MAAHMTSSQHTGQHSPEGVTGSVPSLHVSIRRQLTAAQFEGESSMAGQTGQHSPGRCWGSDPS